MAGPIAFYLADPAQSTQLIPGGNTVASGAQLFVYTVGTSSKQASYTDASASTARTNPIVLDSGGNIPGNGEVWVTSSVKLVLAPSNDTDPPSSPYWTRDNVPGINNITAAQVASLSAQSEWVQGSTATFIGVTAFSVVGDQTGLYTLGRRVKATVTGGDRFGIVTSATLATGSTAVGLTLDSSTLNGGLSVVYYGILSTPNGSIPWSIETSTGVSVTTNALFGNTVTTVSLGVTSSAIFSSSVVRQVGNTTTYVPLIGKLSVNTSSVGNSLNTTSILHSYTLPANALISDGQGIRITAGGQHTASGSSETLSLQMNNSLVFNVALTSTLTAGWKVVSEVFRAGSSTQRILTTLYEAPNVGGTPLITTALGYFGDLLNATENDASTMTFSFKARASTAGTIIQNLTVVEYFG